MSPEGVLIPDTPIPAAAVSGRSSGTGGYGGGGVGGGGGGGVGLAASAAVEAAAEWRGRLAQRTLQAARELFFGHGGSKVHHAPDRSGDILVGRACLERYIPAYRHHFKAREAAAQMRDISRKRTRGGGGGGGGGGCGGGGGRGGGLSGGIDVSSPSMGPGSDGSDRWARATLSLTPQLLPPPSSSSSAAAVATAQAALSSFGVAASLRPTWTDLGMWAVLVGRDDLAHCMWHKTATPLRDALMASQLCRRLADIKGGAEEEPLRKLAEQYEGWATGVLDHVSSRSEAVSDAASKLPPPLCAPLFAPLCPRAPGAGALRWCSRTPFTMHRMVIPSSLPLHAFARVQVRVLCTWRPDWERSPIEEAIFGNDGRDDQTCFAFVA